MLQVDPEKRPNCDHLLKLIDKLRLRNIQSLENFQEYEKNQENEEGRKESKLSEDDLLNTIKIPRDLRKIHNFLPKPNYEFKDPEKEKVEIKKNLFPDIPIKPYSKVGKLKY